MNLLTRGNSKLASSILCWSIAPVVSCLSCSQCARTCYARGPYRRYPSVKKAWARNFDLAKSGEFMGLVIDQISRVKSVSAVRIHVAGDYFSAGYIDQWRAIAARFPAIKFYGYSKCFSIFPTELATLNKRKNVNTINSITPDGGLNFGDVKRVQLLKKAGYRVCPATTPGSNVTCGTTCTLCQTTKKVCFHQH